MKPAGTLLLLAIGLVSAAPAEEPAAGSVSREIAAKIRTGLPAFTPPSPEPEGESAAPTPQTTELNVLILPKITVKEKHLPRDAADHLMSRRDFKRKMENLYLDSLAEVGPLNVLLNNFTIPLFSPSKAARGRAIYQAREIERLGRIINLGNTHKTAAPLDLKRELDNTHTTRPAGGLQKR